MPGQQDQPQYIDETHQRIAEFAGEFLADDQEEHDAFIDGLLERRGYQRTSSWAPPEPQQGGQGQKPGLLKPPKPRAATGGRASGGGGYFKGR
jgi:hypothetical protein